MAGPIVQEQRLASLVQTAAAEAWKSFALAQASLTYTHPSQPFLGWPVPEIQHNGLGTGPGAAHVGQHEPRGGGEAKGLERTHPNLRNPNY